jgi:hypothetical protein
MDEQSRAAGADAASPNRVSWAGRLAGGITSGIVAAILMMSFMMVYSSITGAGATLPLSSPW